MNVTVYCGSSPCRNPHFELAARELGAWLASAGHALVYGGSSVGLMGVISCTVLEAGGTVYGVEPRFFIEAGVAQHDLTELYVVETMSERKAKMIELGDAFVALPGGVGTLEEISEIFSRIRLGFEPAECYLLNIDGFYGELRRFLLTMGDEGFLSTTDIERFRFPESVDELAAMLEERERKPLQPRATATELNPNITCR